MSAGDHRRRWSVGMTLALELASHGVRPILLERKADGDASPKMDLTNGRPGARGNDNKKQTRGGKTTRPALA